MACSGVWSTTQAPDAGSFITGSETVVDGSFAAMAI